jgi:hypothetical protein
MVRRPSCQAVAGIHNSQRQDLWSFITWQIKPRDLPHLPFKFYVSLVNYQQLELDSMDGFCLSAIRDVARLHLTDGREAKSLHG